MVEIEKSDKRDKVAIDLTVSKGYVAQLMKPKSVATLETQMNLALNLDARRIEMPAQGEVEAVLLDWIKIVRQCFSVWLAASLDVCDVGPQQP